MKSTAAKKPKENREPTEHWKAFVSKYWGFCNDFLGYNPLFDGVAQRNLRLLVADLRKRAEVKNLTWDEQTAIRSFDMFLSHAYRNGFAQDFSLGNLNRNREKIIEGIKSKSV